MKCKEKGCEGEIDEQSTISLIIGCGGCGQCSLDKAHPCEQCGRLYWMSGNPVFTRSGEKAFFVDNAIINKE
ncbi:MAG: hypothetical protein WC319_04525 [Candidatus Paceibacterota bacterium]|jgi:hypothetical protein